MNKELELESLINKLTEALATTGKSKKELNTIFKNIPKQVSVKKKTQLETARDRRVNEQRKVARNKSRNWKPIEIKEVLEQYAKEIGIDTAFHKHTIVDELSKKLKQDLQTSHSHYRKFTDDAVRKFVTRQLEDWVEQNYLISRGTRSGQKGQAWWFFRPGDMRKETQEIIAIDTQE